MKYQAIEMRKYNGTFSIQRKDTEKGLEGKEMLRILFPFAIFVFVVVLRFWTQKLKSVYFE